MQLNFKKIDLRIKSFVKYYTANTSPDSSDPNRKFLDLKQKKGGLNDPEEELFFIFLNTHFDSPTLAEEFYQKITWSEIQRIDENGIHKLCEKFFYEKKFTGKYLIGDHRRNFKCLPNYKKVNYTGETLVSYKQAMGKHGPQANFFEIYNHHVEFETLYYRMKDEIGPPFHTRLPRFDHLERLSRTHDFYLTPHRFYSEDDLKQGPFYGLTYLLFGKRFGKDKGLTIKDLSTNLPSIWNQEAGNTYFIHDPDNFKQVVERLEHWVIDRVRESIPIERQDDPALVFDIESCLCNYQKRRRPNVC